MKFALPVLTLVILAATIFVSTTVHASLTPDQIQNIQNNCTSIKTSLGQLQVADTQLRVNRGQFYESLASKLMDSFNSRLSSNKIDSSSLTSITGTFRSEIDTFRSDYSAYAYQLANTISINCQTRPESFQDSLLSSRNLRIKLHQDVLALNQSITDYKNSVDTFATNFGQVKPTGN